MALGRFPGIPHFSNNYKYAANGNTIHNRLMMFMFIFLGIIMLLGLCNMLSYRTVNNRTKVNRRILLL